MALSRTKSILLLVGIAIAIVAVVWLVYTYALQRQSHATITFLDVGQGDATLIQTPQKEQMLVDCGRGAIVLQALGRNMPFFDRTIEHLVVTHADTDHYAGCIEVLERYHVETMYFNGVEKQDDATWDTFINAIRDEGTRVQMITTSTVWHMDNIVVSSLFPTQDLRSAAPLFGAHTNDNNYSVVLKVVAAQRTYLLTGDAEKEEEAFLVRTYGTLLDSDVLKVGHHGSKTSSTELFLGKVTPEVAVISSGKGNRYGHPHALVLGRLARHAVAVRRTDIEGDLSFVLY